ncbi:hypothetical protein MXB_2942, partial [Myxobolus squamalis]
MTRGPVMDGSVDAERSLVTDLVSSIDPSGKLFPMKAINYFAVIAGTGFDQIFKIGNPESSISEISTYEEEYFKHSALFKDGTIKPSQTTSQNLIEAVSECFWDMVKSSIKQESDSFRSRLYALEAEWRHSFPHMRELNRVFSYLYNYKNELFERVRADVSDDAILFSGTNTKEWEQNLSKSLWKAIIPFVFREIYLKNALTSSKVGFQTQIDIVLQHWLDFNVTEQCIEVKDKKKSFNAKRAHPQYIGNTYKDLFKPTRDLLLEECL